MNQYVRDEVRDGFYIPSMMKKAWGSAYLGYLELKRVCNELGIKVFATWGTLLGAARHQGFIPWDDDIDVCMLREDYEILLEAVGRGDDERVSSDRIEKYKNKTRRKETKRVNTKYHIEDYVSTGSDNMVRRWVEKGILIYPPEDWERRSGFPFGDVIDIFIMDSLPPSIEEKGDMMRTIAECQRKKDEAETRDEKISIMLELDDYLKKFAYDEHCTEVVDLLYYSGIDARILPKVYFSESMEVPFEWGTMSVPVEYQDILKRYFGDYSIPVLKFGGHEYPFYKKYLGMLKDRFGFEFNRFKYDADEYKRIILTRNNGKAITERIIEMTDLLAEAHEYIFKTWNDMFMTEEKKTVDNDSGSKNEILAVLEQCQNIAVLLGELLEKRICNSENMVHVLEDYCEKVFSLYEDVEFRAADADVIDGINELVELNKSINRCMLDNLRIKKESLILVKGENEFKYACNALMDCIDDKINYHISIVLLPYKYKNAMGIIEEEEWKQCEENTENINKVANEFGLVADIVSYDGYDVEVEHPNIIIHTYPFDEYGEVLTVHPYYYCSNLRKYCDEFVFVVPFGLRMIEDDDIKSLYTYGEYLCSPGVLYADKVIVPTENMRNVGEKIIGDFTNKSILHKFKYISARGDERNEYC